MNAFYEHHKDSIKFRYGCFDRILLNGCVQSFLDGARAQGFFWVYRKTYPVSRKVLRDVADEYHNWVAAARGNGAWRSSHPPAIAKDRLQQLDRLYQSVTAALDQLVAAVGLQVAA